MSAQVSAGAIAPLKMLGQDGITLDPTASAPTINATTGIFSGPFPPTDGISLGLAAFLPEVLDSGTLALVIDSVVPGYQDVDGFGVSTSVLYYLSVGVQKLVVPVDQDLGAADADKSVGFPALFAVDNKARVYGGDSTFPIYGSTGLSLPGAWRITAWGRGQANTNPANSSENGPRWWAGAANENTPNPNEIVCTPSVGSCTEGVTGGFTNMSRNAGALPGVDTIFHVQGYSTVGSVPQRDFETITAGVTRAADFTVHWGAGGVIDSVHDVTHHVRVPFKTGIRASWGLLTDASFAGYGGTSRDGKNNLLTWSDIYCVAPVTAYIGAGNSRCNPGVNLVSTATLSPIATSSASFAGTATQAATGNGFIFYLNGHFFLTSWWRRWSSPQAPCPRPAPCGTRGSMRAL